VKPEIIYHWHTEEICITPNTKKMLENKVDGIYYERGRWPTYADYPLEEENTTKPSAEDFLKA
jgi:hypothetical protein